MASPKTSAFSLVEVTIALGISAFALAAIVGLLSLTLKNSKSAMDDTLVAEMANSIVSTLRKQEFGSIGTQPPVYFDIGGKRINPLSSSGAITEIATADAISQSGVYVCQLSIVSDVATRNLDGSANLLKISMHFKWPINASSSINEKTVHASLARY